MPNRESHNLPTRTKQLQRVWYCFLSYCLGFVICGCLSGVPAVAYDIGNRWTNTQVDGPGIARGNAITLSWSIVPDGENYSRAINSEVIAYLDDGWNVAGVDRTPDLTNRPWWGWMDRVYDQYSRVSGISMVYVHEQFANGTDTGLEGDVRIGGQVIPENPGQNILADNAFPNNGDMRIDTRRDGDGNADFFHSNGPQLRNLIAHESGHGVGLNHSDIISGANAVMETPLESNFWGLQFDDIYAINRNYGDPLEKNGGNDSFGTAYHLGSLGLGGSAVLGTDASDSVVNENDGDWLGIDGSSDQDWYRVSVADTGAVGIRLRPQGPAYETEEQGAFDAQRQSDLRFRLYNSVGTLLETVDNAPLGEAEHLAAFSVNSPGEYYVRVDGAEDRNQFYELEVAVDRPLVLTVDRDSGNMSVTSPYGDVEFDAYTITSANGALDVAGWQSLQNQAAGGWSEVNSSSQLIGELQSVGTTQLTPSGSLSLGNGYSPDLAGIPFGVDPSDLTFAVRSLTSGETSEGIVEYTGSGLINNLVLTIDPESGDARITNESATVLEIDSYTIVSESGSLLVDWNSLADQGVSGWTEAQPTSTRLSELNPTGAATLGAEEFVSLDGLWDVAGLTDLSDFSFQFRDLTLGTFDGIIEFASLSEVFTADFDQDGDVDVDDLAKWEVDYGVNGGSDANGDGVSNGLDYLAWQRQFGSSAPSASLSTAVPEPASHLLMFLLLALSNVLLLPQRHRNAYARSGCACSVLPSKTRRR